MKFESLHRPHKKDVIGLGLPVVSLGLLTVALDLQTAMALLLVPSFVTNLWQAATGGNAKVILYRLWPFLVMATVTVWIGVAALTRLNPSLLAALLGAQLVIYSSASLRGLRPTIPLRHEHWVGSLIGSANGVTGVSSHIAPAPGRDFWQPAVRHVGLRHAHAATSGRPQGNVQPKDPMRRPGE